MNILRKTLVLLFCSIVALSFTSCVTYYPFKNHKKGPPTGLYKQASPSNNRGNSNRNYKPHNNKHKKHDSHKKHKGHD